MYKLPTRYSIGLSKILTKSFLVIVLVLAAFQSKSQNVFVDENLKSDLKLSQEMKDELNTHANDYFIFTHGKPGFLLIDNQWMSKEQIAKWFKTLPNTENKSIRIFGCEFGKGLEGIAAVRYLEQNLGVTISASDDVTGIDGDWDLEVGTAFSSVSISDFEGNLQTCAGKVGGTAPGDDFDGDGYCNDVDYDDDNDGIPDIYEYTGSAPCVSAYQPNIATTAKNPATLYNLTPADRLVLTDVNSGTEFTRPYADMPYLQGLTMTFNSTTVNEVRIYNFLNGHLLDTSTAHITKIGRIELYNAQNDLLFTISNVVPTTFTGTNYYGVQVPNVEGATRLQLVNIYSSKNGFGLRDVFVTGCVQDYDGDGLPNKFDTDSDGDGCPDAVESNAVSPTEGYKFTDLDARWMIIGAVGTTTGTFGTAGVPLANRNNPVGAYDSTVRSLECDPCYASSTLFADSDGDGIANECDLDNDNDGIADRLECPSLDLYPNEPIITIDLSSAIIQPDPDPNDYFGPSLTAENTAILPDGTCVSVKIDVEQLTTTVAPSFSWNLANTDGTKLFVGGQYRKYRFTVHYYECGTFNPVSISTIYKVRDIDGDCDWNGDGISDNPDCDAFQGARVHDDWLSIGTGSLHTYNLADTSAIYVKPMGYETYFFSSATDLFGGYSGLSSVNPVTPTSQEVYLTFKRLDSFQFNYYTGIFGGIYMDFGAGNLPLCDTDGDGIPDFLDKDSDGDGCFDAIEGSANITADDLNPDGSIADSVGKDGLPVLAGTGQDVGSSAEHTISPCITIDTVQYNAGTSYDSVLVACSPTNEIDTTGGTFGYCNGWNNNYYMISGPAGSCFTASPISADTSLVTADPIVACFYACDSLGLCDTTVYLIQYTSNLGIDYRDFTAENVSECSNTLHWISTKEENTDRAIVQRRFGTDGDFMTVGSVKLAGGSSIEKSYKFEDFNVFYNGDVYYRLIFMDIDGSAGISEIKRVANTCGNAGVVINTYPNPNSGHFSVNVQGLNVDDKYSLRIIDAVGRVIRVQNIDPVRGTYDIDLNGLTSNIYVIEITDRYGNALDYNRILIK